MPHDADRYLEVARSQLAMEKKLGGNLSTHPNTYSKQPKKRWSWFSRTSEGNDIEVTLTDYEPPMRRVQVRLTFDG